MKKKLLHDGIPEFEQDDYGFFIEKESGLCPCEYFEDPGECDESCPRFEPCTIIVKHRTFINYGNEYRK